VLCMGLACGIRGISVRIGISPVYVIFEGICEKSRLGSMASIVMSRGIDYGVRNECEMTCILVP
jgi:hypothetical protein